MENNLDFGVNIRGDYDSISIANYLLYKSHHLGRELNVTKTMKLMYILYGYMLSKYDRLITDEMPMVWPYGPVFPNAKENAKYSSVDSIDKDFIDCLDNDTQLKESVELVLDRYSEFSASQLSTWSHQEGSPWDKAYKKYEGLWNKPISNQDIKVYFNKLFK